MGYRPGEDTPKPDDVLAAQLPGDGIDLTVFFSIKNDLSLAVAVTEVDKDKVFTMVTIAVDPSTESSGLVDMVTTKLAAGVSSVHS